MRKNLENIARWSERKAGTDLHYIAEGGTWLTLGKIFSTIASLLLIIAFGNLVSKTTYGFYQYILSIAGILSITTLPGMTTSLKRAVATGKEGDVLNVIHSRIKWGLIGSFLSLATGAYYLIQGNSQLSISLLILSLFLPLAESVSIVNPFFIGRKNFKHFSAYSTTTKIIHTSVVIVTLYLTQNIIFILLSYFASLTLVRLATTAIIFSRHKLNSEKGDSTLSYGKHLSLMKVLGAVSIQADKIILWHLLGPVSLATYSFALAPVTQLQTWFKSLETLAFPKFASAEKTILKRTLPKKLRKLLFLIIPITLLYILSAPLIYKHLLPQYTDSVLYSQIFALVLLFLPQKLLASSLEAQGQKKALYTINTINPILKIVLLLALIPLFGIWGALAGILFPYISGFILLNYFFKKI